MSGPRASESHSVSEPDLTRGFPGNFFKPLLPALCFIYPTCLFSIVYSETELCVSFQVTASHQGKLDRCGMSWEIKQAITANAEPMLPPLSGVLVLGPARESQHL